MTLRTLSNGICRAFGFVIANNVYRPVRKALYRPGSTKHLFSGDLYLLIGKEGSVCEACSSSSLVISTGLLLREEPEGTSSFSSAPAGVYVEIHGTLISRSWLFIERGVDARPRSNCRLGSWETATATSRLPELGRQAMRARGSYFNSSRALETRYEQLRRLLGRLESRWPPLSASVGALGALDGWVGGLRTCRQVRAGAWHCHPISLDIASASNQRCYGFEKLVGADTVSKLACIFTSIKPRTSFELQNSLTIHCHPNHQTRGARYGSWQYFACLSSRTMELFRLHRSCAGSS